MNSDSYRTVIKYLKVKKAEYHTYQQRENKAFRVVIRNIHPSTPLNEVGIAIQEIGFTVCQVANVRHKITKKIYHSLLSILNLLKSIKIYSMLHPFFTPKFESKIHINAGK